MSKVNEAINYYISAGSTNIFSNNWFNVLIFEIKND